MSLDEEELAHCRAITAEILADEHDTSENIVDALIRERALAREQAGEAFAAQLEIANAQVSVRDNALDALRIENEVFRTAQRGLIKDGLDEEAECLALRAKLVELEGWHEQCGTHETTIDRLTGERNNLRAKLAAIEALCAEPAGSHSAHGPDAYVLVSMVREILGGGS